MSLVYTLNVVDVFDEENRATIACYIDAANSCTCCDDDPLTEVCQGAEKCPGMFINKFIISNYELISIIKRMFNFIAFLCHLEQNGNQ